jgi:hypothetical protein
MSDNAANMTPAAAPPPRTHSLKQRAVDEMRRFFVLFLYLWVLFSMFVLNQGIILREHGIGFTAQGFAVFNALVLAKVMLMFEAFDPGRWLRRRPLIYPILFEAFLLTILFIAFHVVEKVIEGLIHGKTIAASLPSIGGGGLVGLVSAAVIMFVSLIPFFAFRNLSLILGADRLTALLFGSTSEAGGSRPA